MGWRVQRETKGRMNKRERGKKKKEREEGSDCTGDKKKERQKGRCRDRLRRNGKDGQNNTATKKEKKQIFRNTVKVGSLNPTKATQGSMNMFMVLGLNWGDVLTLNRSKQKSKLRFCAL